MRQQDPLLTWPLFCPTDWVHLRSHIERPTSLGPGGAVIETLNVKASPFDETWHLWRPDPHWEDPRLRAIDVPGYETAPWSVARAKIAASRLTDAPLELKRLRIERVRVETVEEDLRRVDDGVYEQEAADSSFETVHRSTPVVQSRAGGGSSIADSTPEDSNQSISLYKASWLVRSGAAMWGIRPTPLAASNYTAHEYLSAWCRLDS